MPENQPRLVTRSLSEILILVGLSILGLALFSALGFGLVHLMTGLSLEEMQTMANDPATVPGSRLALLILQSCSALGSFVIFPSFLILLNRKAAPLSQPQKAVTPTLLGLILGISLLMLPVNGWLAAWNESLHWPSFLKDLHSWALEKETALESLTLYLVDFQSTGEMIFGFIVIALVAGCTEEFFFRRLLQPRMLQLTGNPHLAIWITAFIFSAIHMQFFGLVPRMVLGAIFGYYFYWTGHISLSILAHVLNNGITLAGMILFKKNLSPIDVENPQVIPWYVGAACAGIVWSLVMMVKEESDKQTVATDSPSTPTVHWQENKQQ